MPAIFENTDDATGQIRTDLSLIKAGRVRQKRWEHRLECYQKEIELHQEGCGIREIARQIQIDRATVRKFIKAGEFPEIDQRRKLPFKLDPYNKYLQERWEAGCHNRLKLWREIQEHGVNGSFQSVCFWATRRGLRKEPKATLPKIQTQKKILQSTVRPWSTSCAAWLLLKEEDVLKPKSKWRCSA